jgi:transcriptional regulator with XRE-family HTH domain
MDTEGWQTGNGKAKVSSTTGEAIRKFRKARGASQAKLADKVNMSAPYWSKLENNRKGVPKLETLARVVVAFDRIRKPLTDEELLGMFLAALKSVGVEARFADMRYGT